MAYIGVFIACCFIDLAKKQSKLIYWGLIIFVTVILCFGYTCGSDWRNYELIYTSTNKLSRYESVEFGFVLLVRFFQIFITDFWIFNAIIKILFLCSLIHFFSFFSKSPWICVALSFAFKTLFLIIDCPMRFMMGMAILLIAVPCFFRKEWTKYIVFTLIASTFHVTMLLMSLLLIPLLFSKSVVKAKIRNLLAISICSILIASTPAIYQTAFNMLMSFIGFSGVQDNRALFYAVFTANSFFTIENLWHFIFLLIILHKREIIVSMKYGDKIFTASWLYFSISILVNPIPTSFRLVILLGYFFVISIYYILVRQLSRRIRFCNLTNTGIILWLMLIITKDVYSLPAYYPYTNSIWYILTGHLPYKYRSDYNYNEYRETFGKLPKRSGNDNSKNLNQ